MTFLNLALAIGSAACVIPVVIHLFNRRRYEVLRWGAMHLLAPVVKTRRKRIKLEQLILLLMRMAILALLALCMAGPVVTGWHALSGDAKSSLVLLLDNSYSMDGGADAVTNLELAKRNASKLVEHGRRGSDVSVSLMAGGKILGSSSPSTNRKQIAKEINELPSGFGAADINRSFEHAASAMVKLQHAKRDLVVISDFQSADWSGESAPALNQVTELINNMPLRPTVTLMQVGTESRDNVSIESLDISPQVVAVDQPVTIRVNVRNYSDVPFPNVRVQLKVDGADRLADQIDLRANETGQLMLQHTFTEPGTRVIETIADADSLHADNNYIAVVPVWNRLPVLLVDGDQRDGPLKSETAFLQLALSPFITAGQGQAGAQEDLPSADLLDATSIASHQVTSEALSGARVLVLANVGRLSDQALEAVEQFVAEGNSLLIFPGDGIDSQWYSQKISGGLSSVAFGQLRSRELGPVAGGRGLLRPVSFNLNRQSRGDSKPEVHIASEHYDHPAMNLFNDKKNGRLTEASLSTWYHLTPPQPDPNRAAPENHRGLLAPATFTTIARLSNGDPLLVENAYGDGRVITCATTCDDAWNNLPARPFYLPLMQRLVTYLATAVEPSRNLLVGQTIAANLPAESGMATITMPTGNHVEIMEQERENHGILEFADTAAPGLYTMKTASLPESHYAVVAPREESNLELLSPQALDTLAESIDASVVHSTDEFIAQDSSRRYGREIWRPLYWAMLALVIGEVLLQQMLSGLSFRKT